MNRDWYDTHAAAYARNVGRLVAGATLDIGDYEQGIPERTVTIDRLKDVVVGIDSAGIFAALHVYDLNENIWTLYSDGTISEYETDQTVGRHELKTLPDPAPQGVL